MLLSVHLCAPAPTHPSPFSSGLLPAPCCANPAPRPGIPGLEWTRAERMWELLLARPPARREPAGDSLSGAVSPTLKEETTVISRDPGTSRGETLSGSPAESARGSPEEAAGKGPGRHRPSPQLPRRWRSRPCQHQPGREPRARALSACGGDPLSHSRPALTSSPALAVGPEPGVAQRGAASLSPSF